MSPDESRARSGIAQTVSVPSQGHTLPAMPCRKSRPTDSVSMTKRSFTPRGLGVVTQQQWLEQMPGHTASLLPAIPCSRPVLSIRP